MKARSWEREYCDFFAARRRPLMRTAHGILGSWPAAEDATQQTFVQLYVHWPRIERAAVDSYARRVLVNACFASLRKGRHEVLADAVPELADPGPAPAAEQRVDLETALRSLSARDRAVLVLRFLDDLPVAAVAEVLEVPVGTVKSQTSRALARLEALLAEPRPATDLSERSSG
ncbi:sigma-70 family RNA polymerase sigma factor [Nocardioides panacisoli]|uniref:SigE family RNA polymerase sigma factor n=1 Tax=Nocardioides panacisoli TaxID=627624 RepID=A0ABP7ILR7_9ACTN